MTLVHDGLGITDEDWEVSISVISGTVDEFDLPPEVRTAILGLFHAFRPAVVQIN